MLPPEAPASADAPAPPSRALRLGTLIVALLGGALLVYTIRKVGWEDVRAGLASLGWWFMAVLALGGLRFVARTRSWMACAEDPDEPPLDFRHAFPAMLAADALGNVTPLGLLASEPAKVLLVRRRLSTVGGVSSVAADNVFYTLSVLIVLGLGTVLFFQRTSVPVPLARAAEVVFAGAVAALVVAAWAARRRPAVLSRLAAWAARLTGRGSRASADRLRAIELRFYGLLSWPAGRLLRIALWQAAFHVAAIAEVFLVVRLLPGGEGITWLDAFLLESAGRLITVVFKAVPLRLGVDEAGTALVARALTLDPTVGVTLALVRRLRIICWNGLGLVFLSRHR
ncbi:MAG: lysylphosphatidylglycerol synthase transmembrane domain-containing protein [Vicinamibacterales bacterium]